MAQDITASMDGTLIDWLKQIGEAVKSGEIVAEMDADKATVEIEAPADGVLIAQGVKPGDSISEGAVIGQVGESGEAAAAPGPSNGAAAKPSPQAQAEPAAEEAPAQASAPSNGAQQTAVTEDGRLKVSPVARKMAEDRGIDLAQVAGSGPGGRIVKADVENFQPGAAPTRGMPGRTTGAAPAGIPLAAPTRTPPPESDDVVYEEFSTMRRRIAATTIESQQTIPHFYVTTEIDVAPMLALRKQLNDSLPEGGTRISVNDLVVKATALTLRQFPNLNSHYYGDKAVRYKRIHVGIAVALTQGGVIYIVAQDADKVALGTLAEQNKAMAARAREGKIKPADIQGATFSTSNLGPFDVAHFAAVINPPEAGVLAFGTAKKVPVVLAAGIVGVGERMMVTISVDHRISDGAEGAAFLKAFKDMLENPMRLLM
ncbi:MAG: 2-oxo acid dehydrogenase subunit E2 [Anaerolineae bacterium]|nr:2-oxo acid dehydrogenase subunit E2 [Anaerolineae bacterium]